VSLAAVQASSIYTISPLPSYEGDTQIAVHTPLGSVGGTATGPKRTGTAPGPLVPGETGALPPQVAPAPTGLGGGLAYLIRSPMQALSMAGVWMLFAAAIVGLRRRQALLAVLRNKESS